MARKSPVLNRLAAHPDPEVLRACRHIIRHSLTRAESAFGVPFQPLSGEA